MATPASPRRPRRPAPFRLTTNEGWYYSPHMREWNPANGLDENVKAMFTRGHCHVYAIALSERTGWPVVILSDGPPTESVRRATVGNGAWIHAVCRTPTGALVDITGECGEHGYATLRPVSGAYLRRVVNSARAGFGFGHGVAPADVGPGGNLTCARKAVDIALSTGVYRDAY